MHVTVNLGEVWADEQTAADAIVDRAAEKLLAHTRNLTTEVQQRVRAIADEEIRVAVRPMIEIALTEALQPTDNFGHPKGDPITLSQYIVEQVVKELRAEREGRDMHRRETLFGQIVGREVSKTVGDDLRAAMDEARKTVREAVEARGAEVLAETIARMR